MWRAASVLSLQDETATARTVRLHVADWPGHDAGQHVDVRLTAADGYTAVRSYSLAAPAEGDRIELTVERIVDGEVSSYLADVAAIGDALEVRGPVGGWFVWRPEQLEPVALIAGGSGIVPLMAMVRVRSAAGNNAPFRLLYSARTPESVIYAAELRDRAVAGDGLGVSYAYTRRAPQGWSRPPRRVDAELIGVATWPSGDRPTCYVCGPTPFVESVAGLLTRAGHEPARIRTERFGPSGGAT